MNSFKRLEVQRCVFFQGVGRGGKGGGGRGKGGGGRGEGGRGESSGVNMYKKCHGSAKNSILRQNGDFVILDFESFANMKVTFVR